MQGKQQRNCIVNSRKIETPVTGLVNLLVYISVDALNKVEDLMEEAVCSAIPLFHFLQRTPWPSPS
jgi:hypothetical protein